MPLRSTTARLTSAHLAVLRAGGEVWTRTSAAQALHARVALCVLFAVFCGVMPVLGPSIPILSGIPWNNPLWHVSKWWSVAALALSWVLLHGLTDIPFWRAMGLLVYGATIGLSVSAVVHHAEGATGDTTAAALFTMLGVVVGVNALTVQWLGRSRLLVMFVWTLAVGTGALWGLSAFYASLGIEMASWLWTVLYVASQAIAVYFLVMIEAWTYNHTDPRDITPAVILIVGGRPDEVGTELVEALPHLLT